MEPVIAALESQKGGIGKSTLARLIAREFANAKWRVKIADLDLGQGTSYNWQGRRLKAAIKPAIPVERFGSIKEAVSGAGDVDLLIVDAPPNSSASTLRIARAAHLVILPTGLSLDDMEPAVRLAHELVSKKISKAKIVFAFCRVGDSHLELIESRNYITEAGYKVLAGAIPEKIAYRRASDEGRSLTETRFPTLNRRADKLAQSIIDMVMALQKGRDHG
jgi:chromosome partitioning protein